MIVFLTTEACMYTLQSLTGARFGCALPEIRVESYERILRQPKLPAATYVFCDLERLAHFELRIAGALHAAMTAAGLRALNNPGRVWLRYQLLSELAHCGVNPFTVYRADDRPQPRRFPVFVRAEGGHFPPLGGLIHNQAALDETLEKLRQSGFAGHGLLVVECCPSDRIEGRWFKWGAFCVAGAASLDHIAVDDTWLVKTGRWEQLTPGIVTLEHAAVLENRHARYVSEVFALAGIEFGRADFALSGGRRVLFEINTNPVIYDLKPDPHALRRETVETARQRLAAALFAIDHPGEGLVDIPGGVTLDYCRRTAPGVMLAPRQ